MSKRNRIIILVSAFLFGAGLWWGTSYIPVEENAGPSGQTAALDGALDILGIPGREGENWTLYVIFDLSDCGGCLSEAAVWEELHQEFFSRGLRVTAIGRADSQGDLDAFCRDEGMTFPVHHDGQGIASQALGLKNTPHKLLLDPAGNVVLEDPPNSNPRRQREFQRAVKEMIGIHS